MRKATFLYLESELFHQNENKRLIKNHELSTRQEKRIIMQVNVIDRLYQTVHQDMKLLIEMRYFEKSSWEGVADALGISKISCYKLRRIFIEKLADKLGMI